MKLLLELTIMCFFFNTNSTKLEKNKKLEYRTHTQLTNSFITLIKFKRERENFTLKVHKNIFASVRLV